MTENAEQAEIIEFLERPETHGMRGPIERIDTHVSTVFLAGDRAYKLKRAVKFPYLDFSTPALRKAACEREVAINRRTAPEIYLGVVAVVRCADGGLALGGDGRQIDYLVEMKRFDDRLLLSRLADRGELDTAIAEAATEAIAAFHRGAEPTAGFGAAAGMRATVVGNAASFDGLPAGLLDAAAVDAVQRASLTALGGLGALLDRRAASGYVRHCHGDLHLANICMIDGTPTLFDAIEFNDAIANIDILYDFAFFLMDLSFRRLPREANAALNRYLELDEDFAGLAALPLFLATRAAIRAHVTAAAAVRDGSDAVRDQARRYLSLAASLLAPRRPAMIAIGGLSGSGKSSVARALAPAVGPEPGAVVLRSDTLRKRLAGAAPLDRLDAAHYTPARSLAVYAALAERAANVLAAGHAVIVDAVSARQDERAMLRAVAAGAGAPFVGLWLEAPAETLRRRVAARRGDVSDATPAIVDRQLGYPLGAIDWRRLDASQPVAKLASLAGEEIRRVIGTAI